MRISSIVLFMLLIMGLQSCESIQEPVLKSIEDVDIIEMNTERLELDAYMILNNPNPFALDLANAEFKAIVDEIELAEFNQNYDTKMPANDDFRMPIKIKMDLKKLYSNNPLSALEKGMKIMKNRELEVSFLGSIKVGKGAAKITTQIDQIEKVKF